MRALILPFVLFLVLANTTSYAGPKPLVDPHKTIVELSPKDNLSDKLASAKPGTTLLLGKGTYFVPRALVMRQKDVWIQTNIVSHTIMRRNGAHAVLKANIQRAPVGMFVDYQKGDLHLVPGNQQINK